MIAKSDMIKGKSRCARFICNKCGRTMRIRTGAVIRGKNLCCNCKRLGVGKGVWREQMREIAYELGRCSTCFKNKTDPRYNVCEKCRKNRRIYYQKYIKNNGNK